MAGTVASNTDVVCGAAPVPRGGKLLGMSGELHMIGPEGNNLTEVCGFGFSAEMVPLMDVEDQVDLNTTWDRMVVKTAVMTQAAATDRIDDDWDDVDSTPFIEPGEIDINKLTGLMQATKAIIDPRMEFVSWATSQGGWVAGSPDVYNPSRYKRFSSKRVLIAEQHSVAMCAVTSPVFDQEQTAQNNLSATSYHFLENLEAAMEDMWKMQIGQTEPGAESPYDQAVAAIGGAIAPSIVQPAAALLVSQTWTFFCKSRWTISVPGSSLPNVIEAV